MVSAKTLGGKWEGAFGDDVTGHVDQHAAVRPNWLAEQCKPIKNLKAVYGTFETLFR